MKTAPPSAAGTSYTALVESGHFPGDGTCTFTIPADWMQGRTVYGGLSAAICHEMLLRVFPDMPPARSAQISFTGPAAGTLAGKTALLRQGKSVHSARAGLSGEQGCATQALFTFGATRPSALDSVFIPPPDMPPPEDLDLLGPKKELPAYIRHFEIRSARRTHKGSSRHCLLVRHRDKGACGLPALLCLMDAAPPAVLMMLDRPAPVSTMAWSVNMLEETPETRDGWWLLEIRAENISHGYSGEHMAVWNADRKLVATGYQTVAVYV